MSQAHDYIYYHHFYDAVISMLLLLVMVEIPGKKLLVWLLQKLYEFTINHVW